MDAMQCDAMQCDAMWYDTMRKCLLNIRLYVIIFLIYRIIKCCVCVYLSIYPSQYGHNLCMNILSRW